MRLSRPEIGLEGEDVEYRVQVEWTDGQHALRYRLNIDFADLVSDRLDAALVALLIPAMKHGEDVYLEGTISERLHYSLAGPYQAVLQEIIPSLRLIDIYPEDVQPSPTRGTGVATGFSGGADSFCVLADHHYAHDVPAGFRITHLLYNNVGSHGSGGEPLFEKRYERLRPTIRRIGLPCVVVNSNLDTFYQGWKFVQTHTPRNASVALLLQRGIRRFLYASAYRYDNVYVGPTESMGHSDPVSLPLLSTSGLDLLSVGSEYTRVQKTLRVAELEDSWRALDVCVRSNSEANCSACWKCLRTLFTLDLAGHLSRYRHVFDLEVYQENRARYIETVLRTDDPFSREILSYAKEQNFDFSLASYMGLQTKLQNARRQYRRLRRAVKQPSRVWPRVEDVFHSYDWIR